MIAAPVDLVGQTLGRTGPVHKTCLGIYHYDLTFRSGADEVVALCRKHGVGDAAIYASSRLALACEFQRSIPQAICPIQEQPDGPFLSRPQARFAPTFSPVFQARRPRASGRTAKVTLPFSSTIIGSARA